MRPMVERTRVQLPRRETISTILKRTHNLRNRRRATRRIRVREENASKRETNRPASRPNPEKIKSRNGSPQPKERDEPPIRPPRGKSDRSSVDRDSSNAVRAFRAPGRDDTRAGADDRVHELRFQKNGRTRRRRRRRNLNARRKETAPRFSAERETGGNLTSPRTRFPFYWRQSARRDCR